jgi:uncharacterized protein (UPF0335 family)
MSDAHGVARDQLRAFITRIERLEEEKKTIADDVKDVYGEAKAFGYDTKIMKKVIALRKKDDQERIEEDMVLDTYLSALGMIQGDFFQDDDQPEPAAPTRKPALALQSPRQAAEAVTERTRINPVANVEEGAIGAIAAASHDPASRTDEGGERQHSSTVGFADDCRTGGKEQSDASAVPVGDAAADAHGIPATNSEKAAVTAQDEVTVSPSADERKSPGFDDRSGEGANTGGSHVDANLSAATHQAGPTSFSENRPATPYNLKPNCLNPGKACSGYGSTYCHACKVAMRERETA